MLRLGERTFAARCVNRTVIFVDEGNLTGICSKLGRSIDWLKLREHLSHNKELIEMFVYAGLPPATSEWAEFRGKRERFLHWLENEGFYVVRKQGRPTTHQAYKANVDLMMAVEATEIAFDVRPQTVVLVTGDGDFAFLACRLRRRGIRVEVAAFENNLGEDLKISASAFIDLAKVIRAPDGSREAAQDVANSDYPRNS